MRLTSPVSDFATATRRGDERASEVKGEVIEIAVRSRNAFSSTGSSRNVDKVRGTLGGMRTRHLLITSLVAAPLLLAACSSTSSSTAKTTTTLDPDVAQVMAAATKQAVGAGIAPGSFTVKATVSSANDSWMRFTVAPTDPTSAKFQPYYGYAQQTAHWNVIALGTAQVGCTSPGGGTLGATTTTAAGAAPSGTVPTNVLASFGESCPAG